MPTPTVVISTASGICLKAFSAVAAILILSSLILTTNTSAGKSVVLPTPANPFVAAIPTAPELPVPT